MEVLTKMTWIDNLKNIEPVDLNSTFINGTQTQLVGQVIDNANNLTGGWWFGIAIIPLFILLIWLFNDKEQPFIYDLPRSVLISSGICLFISIIAAITTISIMIQPIIWFSTTLFLSFIGVYMRKEKNM